MNRRAWLQAAGATGLAGLAGCLDEIEGAIGAGDDTVLDPPDTDRGDPVHPTHGEELPDFGETDVVTGETLTRDELLEEDRTILMTFIFSECPDGTCPQLLSILRAVQENAAAEGYTEEVALLAVTFDPETDTAEVLEDEAAAVGLDTDVGNVHLLRPPTNQEAEELVGEHFGAPIHLQDDHDSHEHEEGDHEEEDGDSHYELLLLANPDGVVERSYPAPLGFTPSEIREDVREVVDG